MRIFVAIELPQKIKTEIARIQAILKKSEIYAKWVNPLNAHLTLKFLGSISEKKIDPIKNAISDVAGMFAPFKANFVDFGFFPNEKKPKVLFISTSFEETLKSIADALEEKLEKFGVKKEGRFKAHITLARFKSPKGIDSLQRVLPDAASKEGFPVKEIILYNSTLTKEGPIYKKLFSANLKS